MMVQLVQSLDGWLCLGAVVLFILLALSSAVIGRYGGDAPTGTAEAQQARTERKVELLHTIRRHTHGQVPPALWDEYKRLDAEDKAARERERSA